MCCMYLGVPDHKKVVKFYSSAKFSFYLFADDTNLLNADKNLTSLEKMVDNELVRVSDWLNANKLTLTAKKSKLCYLSSSPT